MACHSRSAAVHSGDRLDDPCWAMTWAEKYDARPTTHTRRYRFPGLVANPGCAFAWTSLTAAVLRQLGIRDADGARNRRRARERLRPHIEKNHVAAAVV